MKAPTSSCWSSRSAGADRRRAGLRRLRAGAGVGGAGRGVRARGRRGAQALTRLVDDRARYTNLLLLLRVTCELTATVLVTIVARSRVRARLAGRAAHRRGHGRVVSYVLVGVGPRTLGRQHPYRVALSLAGPVRAARPGVRPAGVAADPVRQRDHARPGLPRRAVLLRGRAARTRRHGRAARRRRARRARDDPVGLRTRRHDRPRGDGAAHRDRLDRAHQDRAAGAGAGAAQRVLAGSR